LRGQIIEDVWIGKKRKYEDWEPHIQAIQHDRGDMSLRFCYYKRKRGKTGPFVNTAMAVYDWTIEDLMKEVRRCKAKAILSLLEKLSE
jgi:hypothetical protein